MQLNTQGWPDGQLLPAIILSNVSGNNSLEDIDRLEADEGLKTLLHHRACEGMSRKKREFISFGFGKAKNECYPLHLLSEDI